MSQKPARRGGDLRLHFGIYATNFGNRTLAQAIVKVNPPSLAPSPSLRGPLFSSPDFRDPEFEFRLHPYHQGISIRSANPSPRFRVPVVSSPIRTELHFRSYFRLAGYPLGTPLGPENVREADLRR